MRAYDAKYSDRQISIPTESRFAKFYAHQIIHYMVCAYYYKDADIFQNQWTD